MLKRELKVNFKNFLIWTGTLVLLFLVVFLVYPSIVNSENIQLMDEMMKMFPPEMLKALNMDISSIDTAYGWLKTEGFIFILLLIGVYSSILGSNILLKEENDKTIEYLNALPIKRRDIVSQKMICGFVYIVSMVAIIGVFNYIALSLSGSFDKLQYVLLSITPLFSALPLFAISIFVSTFSRKTRKTFGISLGIALAGYFLQILSEMNEETEFFKYFTVYTLSDVRNVMLDTAINPIMIIMSLLITVVFSSGIFIKYEKKELV